MEILQQPVFTVIIITYNRRDLLQRAIQSVLNQTFSSFELLVIDNCSTDGTRFIVQKINDPRIKYIFNPNPTVSSYDSTRNVGIQMAKGYLISILDDDDIWYPKKLEKVKSIFDEFPDTSVVFHNINININNKIISKTSKLGLRFKENIYEELLYKGNLFAPSAFTVKTDLICELGGFDSRKEIEGVADYDLWLRIAAQGNKIYFIKELLGENVIASHNWSIIDPAFQSRAASLIKEHIFNYEKKPFLKISKKGMWHLFQLYYIAGRSFFKTYHLISAFEYYCKAIAIIIIKPSILIELYLEITKNQEKNRYSKICI